LSAAAFAATTALSATSFALAAAWASYQEAIGKHQVLVCFGMKANSNLAVLKEFARLGSGFDIVSGGELARVLAAGADPAKVVFSGVGKQAWEMRAALDAGVKCFNVESVPELKRLSQVASDMGKTASVSLRVNPDVDAGTHAKISTGKKENKFGVAIDLAPGIFDRLAGLSGLSMQGVALHIGSQLFDLDPLEAAYGRIGQLVADLRGMGHLIERVCVR
jgi:diaminopimelate decarboxylase